MGTFGKVVCALVTCVLYFWNPFYIRSNLVDMAYAALYSANLARAQNPDSLKAAVTNVTSDFDQLTLLMQDFFERLPDNTTELLFRDYLKTKAVQSHKDFEYFLDWVLSFYNISWPFVVVYAILKLSQKDAGSKGGKHRGSKKGSNDGDERELRERDKGQPPRAEATSLAVSSVQ